MDEKPQKNQDQGNTHSVSDKIRLEEIVNHSPAVAFIWRAEKGWPVEFVSDNIRQFGYSPEDFYSGKLNYDSIIHPDDLERVIAEIDRYDQKLDPEYSLEYRIITSDKQIRWLDDRTWVKRDGKGKVILHQGVVIDITERKRIENELIDREARLRLITDNMVDVISQTDANLNTLYTSPSLERVVGVRPEEVIGRPALSWIHPEDLEPALRKAAEARKAGLPSVNLEYRWRNAAGEYRWVETVARLLYDEKGLSSGAILVSRDCHDRKLAEEKVRHHAAHAEALARTATQINRQIDLDTTLTSVCENAAKVFNTQAAVIFLVDPHSNTVNAISGYGLPFDYRTEVPPIPLAVLREGLEFFSDKPFVIQDYKSKVRIPGDDLIKKYNIHTIAISRIKWQAQMIGVLIVLSIGNTRLFDDDELALLQSLADESAQAIMNTRFLSDASRRLERLEALRTIDNAIAASLDLRHTLSVFLDQLRHQLNVDAADILLFNPHSLTYDYAFGIGMRTDVLSNIEVHPDDDPIGMIVLNRHRVQIQDFQKESKSDRIRAFITEGFVGYVGVPLIAKGKVRGVLELFHRTQKKNDEEWIDFLESLAGQAAISIDNAALFDDLQRSNLELSLAYDATIEGWSHALDLRDEGTEGHTQRVTRLTLDLAQEMGINDENLTHIRRGVMLHDIGKMGIPDEILHKPDKLNAEELKKMREHPRYAYEMLSKVRYLKPSLDIPYCHHEKWDGTGYPRGLSGEQIPLAARLFAVVDVWDALISDRPYRSAWSKEKAFKYIKEQSGKYFDPEIVKIFLKTIKPSFLSRKELAKLNKK